MTAERITQIEAELAQAFKTDTARLKEWESLPIEQRAISAYPGWRNITLERAGLMAELNRLKENAALEAAFTLPFAATS